ncbi:MAG: hypothetical protein ACK5LK_10430 [Chthoniobacterales bacterium]
MPILIYKGRIYRAFENCAPLVWGAGFQAAVLSADLESDLLNSQSWTLSNQLPFDPAWPPKSWGKCDNPGWLEGNCVATPEGEIVNILRVNAEPAPDKAAIVRVATGAAKNFHDSNRICFLRVENFRERLAASENAPIYISHEPTSTAIHSASVAQISAENVKRTLL